MSWVCLGKRRAFFSSFFFRGCISWCHGGLKDRELGSVIRVKGMVTVMYRLSRFIEPVSFHSNLKRGRNPIVKK